MLGDHPVHIDFIAALLMGFNPQKISFLARSIELLNGDKQFENIKIVSNKKEWETPESIVNSSLNYKPAPGWENIISST